MGTLLYQEIGEQSGRNGVFAMKIGINLLFMLPEVGGTRTYAISLVRALTAIDRKNEYFIFLNQESKDIDLGDGSNIHKVVLPLRARSRPMRYAWEQLRLPQLVVRYRLDILHSLGYVAPLRLRCPSIVTIHDLNYRFIGHEMGLLHRLVLGFFVPRSARHAAHVITVSRFSKDQIVRTLGIPASKISVTHNACKYGTRQNDQNVVCTSYRNEKPYLLALSSNSPHKNILGAIRAFASIQRSGKTHLKLLIAGCLPRNMTEISSVLKKLGIENTVRFLGYVADEDLLSLYRNAEVFLFPSLYEGFGIPVLEAFACGTPVVCSNAGALPEVAGDAAILVDPREPAEMAKAACMIMDNSELRRLLIERGFRQVRMFSWEQSAQITLQVYREVLNAESLPGGRVASAFRK